MSNSPMNILKIKIPEKWEVKSFNSICGFDKKTYDPTNLPEKTFNYISISDVENYQIKTYQKMKGSDAPSRARKLVNTDDIIISTVRPYLRAFAKINSNHNDFICSTGFSVLTPKNVLSDYIYYLIQTEQFVQELMRRMVGATYPAVTSTDIKHLKVPVPPLVEQRGIAEVLGTIDEAIRLTDRVIERTEALKRGLMQRLLTQGIGNTEYKDTPIGKIPTQWEVFTLDQLLRKYNIISHLDGNHGSKYPRSDEFVNIGIPYISANCIINNEVDFNKCKYLTKERANQLTKGIAKSGDVLLAHNATVGPTAILFTEHEKVILSTSLTYYRCDPNKINKEYLFYYLSSWVYQKQLKDVMLQSTRNQVPITTQRKLLFLMPNIDEQKNIANMLSPIEYKLKSLRLINEKLKSLKSGLMQILLSGERRVELREDGLHRVGDGREANN